MKLNVGCGRDVMPDWINLDAAALPGVGIVFDLETCAHGARIPLEDGSVDEFLLSHVLEHMRSPLPIMQELHRIAEPGAVMTIVGPYGSSNDADEDPTHVRRLFEGSFYYFGQPYYWRADYGYRGDWEVRRMVMRLQPWCVVLDKDWKAAAKVIRTQRNQVREIVVVLRAVKPIREARQELNRNVTIELAPAGDETPARAIAGTLKA